MKRRGDGQKYEIQGLRNDLEETRDKGCRRMRDD